MTEVPVPSNQPPPAPEQQWNPVGKSTEWPAEGVRVVKIGARRIGVYRHNNEWFALKDMCPHAGVALSQGPVRDQQVMCVGHGWVFHLKTGECTRGPTGFKTSCYDVRVSEAGEVEVFA
jgi:nitrite reductase/ring-hydroxylating ferredoxin subunit